MITGENGEEEKGMEITMNKIFIGLFFVFIDVNITLGNSAISMIPDFIGYILIYFGLKQMEEESYWFGRTKSLVIVMFIYSTFGFFSDLTGLIPTVVSGKIAVVLIGYLSTIAGLYIAWSIIKGIQDMETEKEHNFFGRRSMASWKMIALFQLISPLFGIIGQVANAYLASVLNQWSMLLAIAGVIASIIFLMDFKYSRDAYIIYRREQEK